MANNYQGYLIKFGNNIMPNSYFNEYSSTPNQRLDSDAERDNLGNLQRSTLPNSKTTITFSTHILFLEEKLKFQEIINLSIINEAQRKCYITYWNDETNAYSSGYFYIPDIEFSLLDADAKTIKYNPISIELIEY